MKPELMSLPVTHDAALTRAALAEARRAGWEIVPACSYVAAYIERHPEFTDLITPPNQP